MRAFLSRAGVFVAVLAGCSSGPGTQHLQTFSVPASQASSLTVSVGALAGTRLDLPAGALATATDITVDVGSTSLVTTPQSAAGPVAVFGPSGLHFNQPVQVSLPYTLGAGLSTSQLFVGVWEADGTNFIIPRSALSVDPVNHLVRFAIQGFTSFQCGINPNGGSDAGVCDCRTAICPTTIGTCPTPEALACDPLTGDWVCAASPQDAGPTCGCCPPGYACDAMGQCIPPGYDAGLACGVDFVCPPGEYCDSSGQCAIAQDGGSGPGVPDSGVIPPLDGGSCGGDCRLSNCGPPIGICPPNEGIVCDPSTGYWLCTGLASDGGSPGNPDSGVLPPGDGGSCLGTGVRCLSDANCLLGQVCLAYECAICGGG